MLDSRPNILYIMTDDHAAHAITAYGSVINETPNIDRIANEGARFDNVFCGNAICAPSRATILAGNHSHINGVLTLADRFDGRQPTFPKAMQAAGYQTAIFGKWHLGHGGEADPTGFDTWTVLPGQGDYHDPTFFVQGEEQRFEGYVTDLITDFSIDWLEQRDPERPFLLKVHHKAPHRPWDPDEKHEHLYEDIDIPIPETFDDDYATRPAAEAAEMRVGRDMTFRDLKEPPPKGLSPEETRRWAYQRYIKDYLRCVASVDDNVGRLLDWLDDNGLAENTVVVYTSDQGFFLGDHGWYDKRFMYEESLRMPFLMRYPPEIEANSVVDAIVSNIDFGPTFLDYAGLEAPEMMQGASFREVAKGNVPEEWQESIYYRYWMHLANHGVAAHYGVRTATHKLIYYYGRALGTSDSVDQDTEQYWELFDLEADPKELNNVYGKPDYTEVQEALHAELARLRQRYGDTDAV
ncbi:MAG TPA: sulfatase [Thermomicrobiales bacterium]|nr:sulfatase [Thermomicrobiales bacterium]